MSRPTYREFLSGDGIRYVADGRNPMDGMGAYSLFAYERRLMMLHPGVEFTQRQLLPDGWFATVNGNRYPEMWLRRYAFMRHFHSCTVIASDYACKATRVRLPLVRSLSLDQKLLCAFASMAKFASKPVHPAGYKAKQRKRGGK